MVKSIRRNVSGNLLVDTVSEPLLAKEERHNNPKIKYDLDLNLYSCVYYITFFEERKS